MSMSSGSGEWRDGANAIVQIGHTARDIAKAAEHGRKLCAFLCRCVLTLQAGHVGHVMLMPRAVAVRLRMDLSCVGGRERQTSDQDDFEVCVGQGQVSLHRSRGAMFNTVLWKEKYVWKGRLKPEFMPLNLSLMAGAIIFGTIYL